ncbi:unnamed protein product [Orchesella dallaii]|uniref:Uncharacterized protein n=1 Tax=Orchesella dallaii TaxID=48710 RepID=A0ABP1RE18_9HEXA
MLILGKNAIGTIMEIFEAGLVTTSQTLNWLTLHLTHHPHVQAKLHEEIDRVVGQNRDPFLHDKPKMPYTEAVIQEIRGHSNKSCLIRFFSETEVIFFRKNINFFNIVSI